jgi:hypothetical protein
VASFFLGKLNCKAAVVPEERRTRHARESAKGLISLRLKRASGRGGFETRPYNWIPGRASFSLRLIRLWRNRQLAWNDAKLFNGFREHHTLVSL